MASPQLDPELAAGYAAVPIQVPDLGHVTHEELPGIRAEIEAMIASLHVYETGQDVEVGDLTVPGPEGDPDIRLRVYRPEGAAGPLPGMYWIHGGGMILGSPDQDDLLMFAFAERLRCTIVSVEYRLAPEHPHPAPVEDCYAGFAWTAKNAAELGIDPERLIIGGASAGGGLAAGTVLMARDRGGPAPAFQFLLYPMLDDRNITPSSLECVDTPIWNRSSNLFGWRALLGEAAGTDGVSPYAAPARATDLSGLPPAYITVGTAEPFRDECITYAQRLVQAGVPAELHVYPGAFHAFENVVPDAALSRQAADEYLLVLRRALAP